MAYARNHLQIVKKNLIAQVNLLNVKMVLVEKNWQIVQKKYVL